MLVIQSLNNVSLTKLDRKHKEHYDVNLEEKTTLNGLCTPLHYNRLLFQFRFINITNELIF